MMTGAMNIRQVAQYPRQSSVPSGSIALLQLGELGSPYGSIAAQDLVATALASGGRLQLDPSTGAIVFGQGDGVPAINVASGEFLFSLPLRTSALNATFVDAPSITRSGIPVITQADLDALPIVTTFNSRSGDVQLELPDILRGGGAPIRDAHFAGWITAPSVWDTRANDDTVATTDWVHRAIHDTGVSSFNGRTGDIVLTTADINAATSSAPPGVYPTAPSPALGDASSRIATTLFVDESLDDLHLTISAEQLALLTSTYAPLNSPAFTGLPTAPTANPGTSTGQLATTSFVMHAITASTTGVASFNTRTGAVTLQASDISGAGGALLNSPALVGTPTAPTAAPGTGNTTLATTAFVQAAVTAATSGVSSFNTRTGAVTLTLADVTGTNVLVNTALTGVPTAPTAAPGTSSTQVATTAFVAASGVSSFMSRTGAVTLSSADVSAAGGALTASPSFTGTPTAPTAAPGTSSTQLATTAFVAAALSSGGGVTTFNGRAGAVTLTAADVTGAGGALLASPVFTGTPSAPTPVSTDSSTALATTAFVQAALTSGAATPGWTFALSGGVSRQTAAAPAILNLASGAETWNPADKTSNVTLSNGNLTATASASGVGGVRGANGLTSGKYYWEVTMSAWASITTAVGFGLASATLSPTSSVGWAIVLGTGSISVNNAGTGYGLSVASGSVIGVAADLVNNLCWFRVCPSGNWNGSTTANPATGTGGISITGMTGTQFPGWLPNNAGDAATANFGASAFSGAVPSGFAAPGKPDYQINNKNLGGIIQILDNTSASSAPANYLQFRNNVSGQPSIISTVGTDANRGIQLVPAGTGTVQAPTMTAGDNSTALATTAFVTSALGSYLPLAGGTLTGVLYSVSANPAISLRKSASGGTNMLQGCTGTVLRWMVEAGNTTAESGSNVGSDFTIDNYTDAGAQIGTPLGIARSNSKVWFGTSFSCPNVAAGSVNNVQSMNFVPATGLIVEGGPNPPVYVNRFGSTGNSVVFQYANTTVGSISVTASATAYNTSSDGRLKTDFRDFSAGSILDRLRSWDFRWRSDGRRAHGLVAQEAIEVYPEAVTHDADDGWGIDYSRFVPLLIAEIKELRMRVAALEAV